MEYREMRHQVVGEADLLLAVLFGKEPSEEAPDPREEEAEIEDEAAAEFYLSYFSYARPSAVHRPMKDGEGS